MATNKARKSFHHERSGSLCSAKQCHCGCQMSMRQRGETRQAQQRDQLRPANPLCAPTPLVADRYATSIINARFACVQVCVIYVHTIAASRFVLSYKSAARFVAFHGASNCSAEMWLAGWLHARTYSSRVSCSNNLDFVRVVQETCNRHESEKTQTESGAYARAKLVRFSHATCCARARARSPCQLFSCYHAKMSAR